MLNENAKKWVAALRSGEYRQGKNYLNNAGKFCCLGIACELASQEGVTTKKVAFRDNHEVLPYDGNVLSLPTSVKKWLGLRLELGQYGNGSLAHLNDTDKTFAEIADVIESEPVGLFA
jgi:hypothetical protein